MKIAIFSDLHGKVLLPFKLVELYQNEMGEKIDLILQCGDIGCFPNKLKLDKATLRFSLQDRDELGFTDDFAVFKPLVGAFLDTLDIEMYCVRGNHEDHDYLDELEGQYHSEPCFPVDVYEKVFVCKSGHIIEFESEQETLTVVGIGRIGDHKGRSHQRFIQPYERKVIKKLMDAEGIFDILITHDKDGSSRRGGGMPEIQEVLEKVIFHYHFHGHTGEPFSVSTNENGITKTIKVKELQFDKKGMLPPACMLVLNKFAEDKFDLEVVEQDLTNKLTKFNWKNEFV